MPQPSPLARWAPALAVWSAVLLSMLLHERPAGDLKLTQRPLSPCSPLPSG